MALSAVIQALYETNTVAIVRRVYSNAASPRIGVLTPHIKSNYEVRRATGSGLGTVETSFKIIIIHF